MNSSFPLFNSEFLNDLVYSFNGRRKAIKYKVSKVSLEKRLDLSSENVYEKLEIELNIHRITLRFYFWDDRFSWVDIRQSSKNGWLFEWTTEGRIGATKSCDILKNIELSIAIISSELSIKANRKLNSIWRPILFEGPSLAATNRNP